LEVTLEKKKSRCTIDDREAATYEFCNAIFGILVSQNAYIQIVGREIQAVEVSGLEKIKLEINQVKLRILLA